MKSLYCISILMLAILSIDIQAQTPDKGFIVKLDRDTIQGYIIDKTDSDLGFKIEFKTEKKDKNVILYSTADLLGFGFEYGRVFERVAFNDSLHDTIKVFAKRVLEGRIKLLVWRKNSWTDFDVFLFNSNPVRSVHLTEPVKKVIEEENGIQKAIYKINHIGLLKYVMDDTASIAVKEKTVKYTEKEIVQSVLLYDQEHQAQYPVIKYKERKKNFFDITVGMPILLAPEGTNFRIAFYVNRYSPEKNRNFSLLAGLSYRVWKGNSTTVYDSKPYSENYQQQWISIIPVGLNIHSKSCLLYTSDAADE